MASQFVPLAPLERARSRVPMALLGLGLSLAGIVVVEVLVALGAPPLGPVGWPSLGMIAGAAIGGLAGLIGGGGGGGGDYLLQPAPPQRFLQVFFPPGGTAGGGVGPPAPSCAAP